MTTQSMGLMFMLSELLDPRDGVKRPYKAKHEERTQRNAELDEFSSTRRTDALASVHPMIIRRSNALALAQVCAPLEIKSRKK